LALLCFARCHVHRSLLSFPTRRSSDLSLEGARRVSWHHRPDHLRAWHHLHCAAAAAEFSLCDDGGLPLWRRPGLACGGGHHPRRSEEHTSVLQSRENLICRLLLEKKER